MRTVLEARTLAAKYEAIAEERLRLRGLLQAYAETGANPFGDAGAFLHDFTDGGEASRRGDGEAREAAILQLQAGGQAALGARRRGVLARAAI